MNETKLTCFNFVVGKGLTLVTLVWLEKPWKFEITLKWLQRCQKRTKNEYFVNQTKDRTNDRTKNDYFVNQTKDRTNDRTKNDYFVNQTKDRMASTNTLKTVKMQCYKLPNWLKSNPVVPLQTNPLVFSTCRKSDSLFAD